MLLSTDRPIEESAVNELKKRNENMSYCCGESGGPLVLLTNGIGCHDINGRF